MADHHGTEPRSDQASGTDGDGGPVHRCEERKDQRCNAVRDAEDHVLGGVGMRERRATGPQ
jgi:hypothetical protein